jgi:hypothetical protein
MRTQHSQSGLTFVGFLFVAVVLVTVAIIGFRIMPSYIEYFAIEKTLRDTLKDAPGNVTLAQFQREFDLKASPQYIESVRATDIALRREGSAMVANADWTTTLPLIGNVSLLIEFHASASK